MSDNAVTGKDLKRMLKFAKEGPVAFAFNAGKSPKDEHYMAMHRKRPAKMLWKEARTDGPSEKAASGMATVEGKDLRLQCDTTAPNIAKKLKAFLRKNKAPLNVVILDAEGNVLESDIEDDLPDDPDLMGDGTPEAEEEVPRDAEEEAAAEPADDPSDIVAGLKRLQPAIAGAPGPAGDKLKKVMAAIVGQIKSGQIAPARETFAKLEAAVARLSDAAAETAPASDGDRLRALAAQAKQVQTGVAHAPAAAQDKLKTALQAAVKALKGGQLDVAEATLGKIDAALAKLGGKPADAPQTGPNGQAEEPVAQGGDVEAPAETGARDDAKIAKLRAQVDALRQRATKKTGGDAQAAIFARLDTALAALDDGDTAAAGPAMRFAEEAISLQDGVDALMPDYTRAVSTGAVEDPQKLRILFQSAVELVAGPDHARGWGYLRQAEEAIIAGAAANTNAFLADIGEDVRPFAMSRLNWSVARSRLYTEIGKLQGAIIKACGNDPDLADVVANLGTLTDYIENLDVRLADRLEDIVTADTPQERIASKKAAREVLAEYQNELLNPFFKDVDASNGFAKVAVTETAMKALGDIDKVLAA